MNELGNELVKAARYEIGQPFQHHYKPVDLCGGGRKTVDECMERGMDHNGYDCSGLVISSLCTALGIQTNAWPREYRHSFQLKPFGIQTDPSFGDILLIDSRSESGYQYNTHSGIYVEPNRMVHANGKTKIVEEGEPMGVVTDIRVIELDVLLPSLASRIKSIQT